MDTQVLPRAVAKSLQERLRVMPAVIVSGARQTGKSTLALSLGPDSRRYFSLDDLDGTPSPTVTWKRMSTPSGG